MDPIGLNIDDNEKSIFGYHLKGQPTIKKRMIVSLYQFLTTCQFHFAQRIKRYKMLTLDPTLKLLIYKGFPFFQKSLEVQNFITYWSL